jgi:WD40 repeat protein
MSIHRNQDSSLEILAESTRTYVPSTMEGDWFPKGCQFSPDGLCVLTARCHQLQLYNTPMEKNYPNRDRIDWDPVLTYDTGDAVRKYAWYPPMKSSEAVSCCFVGVSRDSPVHLYDAYTQVIRATYCPYNAMDEMESPTTVSFVEDGQKLVTGGFKSDRMLHVFDVNRPGRQPTITLKLGKTRRSKDGQKGLVSALAYSQQSGVIAVGTYSPGSVYLYDLRMYVNAPAAEVVVSGNCLSGHGKSRHSGKRTRFLDNTSASVDKNNSDKFLVDFSAAKSEWYQNRTRSGVTQLEFDSANQYLFSCSRRSMAVIQWDLRKLSSSNYCPGIASFEIDNDTNQLVEFQLHESQIWMGGMDRCVRVYDQPSGRILAKFGRFKDAVNGVSLSTSSGETLLAVSTGTRHFAAENDDDVNGLLPFSGSIEVRKVTKIL